MDVVERYDIDAIHIDDYFYPYRESRTVDEACERPHASTCVRIFPSRTRPPGQKYGIRGYADRTDWRRANIDKFVEQLYEAKKAKKPWVQVGISPFGIWRSGTPPASPDSMPTARSTLTLASGCARAGWTTWRRSSTGRSRVMQRRFTRLDDWWRTQNPKGRAIYPGLFDGAGRGATGRAGRSARCRRRSSDALDARLTDEANGHIHFRMSALQWNSSAIGERMRTTVYAEPALFPAMPWLGGTPPSPPTVTSVITEAVEVAAGDATPVAVVDDPVTRHRWSLADDAASGDTERRIAFNDARRSRWPSDRRHRRRSGGPDQRGDSICAAEWVNMGNW